MFKKNYLLFYGLLIIVVFLIPGCGGSPTTPLLTYTVGNTGPAGGLIFYDKGIYSDGWRYLEAAPSDQSTGIQWYNGYYVLTGATGTAIGTGQSNTTAIVTIQGAGSYAAQLCNDLTVGGYSDWFLPSKDELDMMYEHLNCAGIGGFIGDWETYTFGIYHSSSEQDLKSAWYQVFPNGFQNGGDKSIYHETRVRAVRAF